MNSNDPHIAKETFSRSSGPCLTSSCVNARFADKGIIAKYPKGYYAAEYTVKRLNGEDSLDNEDINDGYTGLLGNVVSLSGIQNSSGSSTPVDNTGYIAMFGFKVNF